MDSNGGVPKGDDVVAASTRGSLQGHAPSCDRLRIADLLTLR